MNYSVQISIDNVTFGGSQNVTFQAEKSVVFSRPINKSVTINSLNFQLWAWVFFSLYLFFVTICLYKNVLSYPLWNISDCATRERVWLPSCNSPSRNEIQFLLVTKENNECFKESLTEVISEHAKKRSAMKSEIRSFLQVVSVFLFFGRNLTIGKGSQQFCSIFSLFCSLICVERMQQSFHSLNWNRIWSVHFIDQTSWIVLLFFYDFFDLWVMCQWIAEYLARDFPSLLVLFESEHKTEQNRKNDPSIASEVMMEGEEREKENGEIVLIHGK